MVNKMGILFKLWLLKLKGTLRNLFKHKLSGVFVIIMIIFYGAIIVSLFNIDNTQMISTNKNDFHISILILIGFLALLLFSTLMQSKKALFYGEDAFYLFTGPFTKRQIMSYLTFQTTVQSALLSLIGLVIFAFFSIGSGYTFTFIFLAYLVSALVVFFFLLLTDYLYVLSIGDEKYRIYSKLIPAMIIAFVALIIIVIYIQTGNYKTLFIDFIKADLFYIVPVFGWMKLVLVAYVEQNYQLVLLGFGCLLGAIILVYALFINYKGNFYEQALQDALDLSRRMKKVKAGNQDALRNIKIKKSVSGNFKQGAYAVMSKNILLMKKTNNFIGINDLISIGIYIVVTIVADIGFGMFVYMMVIWVFSSLQNSALTNELKNYQIYLIPDKPFNKLIAVIVPTFIKIFIVTAIAFILMGLYYQINLVMIFTYLLYVLGYTSIFISGNVLSLRILKSRSSAMFENFMRMIIMLIGSIPSAIIIVVIYLIVGSRAIIWGSYVSLIMNFAVSFLILYGCQNMMNGRELKSE